jgi:hypothetical protein
MSTDPHRPTTAGPTPQPSPTVTAGQSTPGLPAGSYAAGSGDDKLPLGVPADHPEYLVGAAFAGGFVAAFVLKRLGGS